MQEELIFESRGAELTARLTCEIDHHKSRRIRAIIDKRIFEERPESFILDFSGVSFMDSSGLGLILGRSELCRARGVSFSVSGTSESILKLLRLSGIDRMVNICIKK